MSWSSPRCNVGAGPYAPGLMHAGPAQIGHRHLSAPGEGILWALAFPGSMANAKGEGTCVA